VADKAGAGPTFEKPKSAILSIGGPLSSACSRIFSSFRSRCMTWLTWQWCTALMSCRKSGRATALKKESEGVTPCPSGPAGLWRGSSGSDMRQARQG